MFDADGVVGLDGAGGEDDGHDTCAWAAGAGVEGGLHEIGAEVVHEAAGGAEAGELDDGSGAEMEVGAEGKIAEIEVAGGDVFAELAWVDGGEGEIVVLVSFADEHVQEFGVQEVDLGAVWGGGVSAGEVTVADSGAAMGVSLNAEAGEKVDGGLGEFRKGVGRTEVHGEDDGLRHERGTCLPVLTF